MMRALVLTAPLVQWECPSCGHQEKLPWAPFDGYIRSPMHDCPKTGMTTPYVEVPEGRNELDRSSVRQTVHEREDYIGDELVQFSTTDGRPVMSIHTERADGSFDNTVYAPCATRSREDI